MDIAGCSLAELIDDPLTGLVMKSDGVDLDRDFLAAGQQVVLGEVSRCGIWSSLWLPGITSIAPFPAFARVKATQAVTTSGWLKPQ